MPPPWTARHACTDASPLPQLQADFSQTCPAWSLHWNYRKRGLLREMLSYKCDILCLQEVQSDHYLDFWAPELQKAGYMAIYKRKTTEIFTENKYAIDGCATFFRRDRFQLVKKYEVSYCIEHTAEHAPAMLPHAGGHLIAEASLHTCCVDAFMGCARMLHGVSTCSNNTV